MPDILFRNAAVAPATADEAARTVEVVWSTGAAVRRFDLDGPFTEVLSLDPAHVDLSRLIGGSVLDAHQQAELRNVLGVVLSASVDGRQGTGTLQFSARPDVEPIWQDVRAGILRHISVGYTVERWHDTVPPSGERVRTAIAWTPIELSFVPTPADPGASTRIPAMYGTAIATLESDVVWGILTVNANMADGVALFHATHKNLAGTGATLSVTTVGEGRAAMAKQTGLDKKTVLNIRPSFVIVPSALELAAEQLLAQNLTPAKSGDVVPQSIRTLTPIAEPRLDAVSATAWYLAASPAQIDTIEYAYLESQQGAYIETRNGFDVDGVEIKCRLDFGAKAIDWRGLYKNAGA